MNVGAVREPPFTFSVEAVEDAKTTGGGFNAELLSRYFNSIKVEFESLDKAKGAQKLVQQERSLALLNKVISGGSSVTSIKTRHLQHIKVLVEHNILKIKTIQKFLPKKMFKDKSLAEVITALDAHEQASIDWNVNKINLAKEYVDNVSDNVGRWRVTQKSTAKYKAVFNSYKSDEPAISDTNPDAKEIRKLLAMEFTEKKATGAAPKDNKQWKEFESSQNINDYLGNMMPDQAQIAAALSRLKGSLEKAILNNNQEFTGKLRALAVTVQEVAVDVAQAKLRLFQQNCPALFAAFEASGDSISIQLNSEEAKLSSTSKNSKALNKHLKSLDKEQLQAIVIEYQVLQTYRVSSDVTDYDFITNSNASMLVLKNIHDQAFAILSPPKAGKSGVTPVAEGGSGVPGTVKEGKSDSVSAHPETPVSASNTASAVTDSKGSNGASSKGTHATVTTLLGGAGSVMPQPANAVAVVTSENTSANPVTLSPLPTVACPRLSELPATSSPPLVVSGVGGSSSASPP